MGQNLIVAKNIKTGEVVEFATQKEATDYFKGIYGDKIRNSNVVAMLKQKTAYKGTWDVNYIGDGQITKKCDHCGKEFKTRRKQQRFCDGVCRDDYYAEKALVDYKDKLIPKKSEKEKELIHKLYLMLEPIRTK
jgi:hypothetical protein